MQPSPALCIVSASIRRKKFLILRRGFNRRMCVGRVRWLTPQPSNGGIRSGAADLGKKLLSTSFMLARLRHGYVSGCLRPTRSPGVSQLGVTAIELMPLADFPGLRNWGYDGVFTFAPDSVYGRLEDLKQLIQSAHRRGLMVLLDVVYNHFGPEGNYLNLYAPQFFTDRHHTPWGKATTSTVRTAGSREISSFRMRCIGWRNTTSMACGWMRFTPLLTSPRRTF